MTTKSLLVLPALIALAYLASSVDQAIFQATGLKPLYGQVAIFTAGLLGLLVVALAKKSLIDPKGMAAQQILYLIVAYILLTVLSFLYSPQDEIVVEFLIQRVKFALLLIIAIVYFQIQGMRRGFEIASIFLVLLATATCVLDFIQPTFSSVPGRGAGFYINANDAGVAIIFLALVASRLLNSTACLALWSIASIGVLATFSRGAWLALIISLIGLTMAGKFGGGRARFVFVGFVTALLGLVFSFYLSGDLYLMVVRSPIAELLDANTLARLGQRGLDIDDYSTLERADVFWLGISRFASSPFIGHGVGSTISWEESVGTHNMLVMLGAELGVLGIGIYLALFTLVIARTQGSVRLIAVIAVVAGMTSHNQFDTISLGIPLAYAIASMRTRRGADTAAGLPTPRRMAAPSGRIPLAGRPR